MDMKKLIEAVDQFAGQAVGQKPGDQVRGTERATKKKSGKHPFDGRLVGASEGTNLLVDLEKQIVEGSQERRLKEEFANYISPVNELAVDDGGDSSDEDILHKFARMWWAGDEATQLQIEKTLDRMGWEIGEDEGGYDNGGVFVVRAGDVNGNSYQSWAAEDLTEGVAEGRLDELSPRTLGSYINKATKDAGTLGYGLGDINARPGKYKDSPDVVKDVKHSFNNRIKGVEKASHRLTKEQGVAEGSEEYCDACDRVITKKPHVCPGSQGVAEGDLNELAPSSGEGGNGPFDYGSAIIEIGQNFVDNYADSAAGEDAADIIQVGKTFMSAGMTKGISALFALDTQVYDHVLDELSSLGFNVDLDIISKRRAPTLDRDAQNAMRAVRAKFDAQPGQVYLVTGHHEFGSSSGKIKATSPEAAKQKFIANAGMKFNKVDVKPYQGVAEGNKSKVDLPPPENARKTQIAGTLPTYKKAADILAKTGIKGRALDFGAGLGHGTKELGKGAHSYEPFPGEKFKPHFVEVGNIPDNAYHKIVNLNVLNVVPNAGKQRIRDAIVKHIGRVLAPGGVAIVTTRGKDVLTIKGTPGEEPMSMISKIGTYQKGFTATELQEYVQDLLGDEFTVSKIRLGPAGIMIKKSESIDEDWRSKLAGAALAGTMALGAGGAYARVTGDYVDDPEINRLTGKPKVTQVEPTEKQSADVATVKKAPGFSAEYLKSVIDGTHPRPLISKERAQELLQQQQQPTNETDDEFASSTRAADQIAASKWRRGGEMTGTSLKGYIETTYADLESVFGAPYYGPNDTDGDKITCEWLITFKDGKVATIYDWKIEDATPTELYRWHIGGSNHKVVDYIATLMGGKGTAVMDEGLDEEHHRFARNVYFNVTADKLELAQAVSKSIGFHPTSKDGIWKYSVMKNENPENTNRKVEQLEKYFGPHIIARKNNIGESVGASVDLTKNYSNYNSVKGQVVEISPKGRLRIKITTADIDPGRRAAIKVGDVINVASNYVKKGMSESGEIVYEAIKPEQLSQLSQLKRDLQQKSMQPPAPVDQDEIDAWERDFRSTHGTRTFAQDNPVAEPEAQKADWRTLPRQGRNKVKTQLQKSNELISIGEKIVKLLDRAERFPGGLPPGIRSDVENVESAFDGDNIDYDRMLEMYTKLVTELVNFVNMKRAVYRKPKTPRYESEYSLTPPGAAVQTDTHSPSPIGYMEEDRRKSHLSRLMDQIDQLGHKEVTEEIPPPVATAGGPAGSPPNVQQPNAPVDPAQQALLKQQQAKMQQNLANLKTAGVNIDPAKAAQSLQKTDTGAPLNAMDKDNIAAMAPAIGNVMSNPSTATQLNTLIKKAGGGA